MPSPTDRTYYQYQLLRKVRFTPIIKWLYAVLGFIACAAAIWTDSLSGLLYVVLAWVVLYWLHYVIARSIFLMDRYTYRKRWGFQWRLPWIGFLPLEHQYVGFRYWRKILLLQLAISFIIIALLIPWVPIGLTLQLLFWQLWLMGPRVYAMVSALFIKDDKLIKFESQEFMIYKA